MKPDRLDERRILLSAEDMARHARRIGASNVAEIDGRTGAVWTPADPRHDVLEVRGLRLEDPGVNWLGIWMHVSEARPSHRAWIVLCTGRWPEGWQEPHGFSNPLQLDWKGWKFLHWPIEDFVRIGAPKGFHEVSWFKIHYTLSALDPVVAGEPSPPMIALADLEAGIRRQPTGPRVSVEELAEDLELHLPGERSTENELLEHYTTRRFPPYVSVLEASRHCDTVAIAERMVVQGRWRCFDVSLGDGRDPWLYRPEVTTDRDLRFYLHNHDFLRDLCDAYQATGRVRYLEKGRDLVLDWIRRFPVPIATDGGTGLIWGALSPAFRALTWSRAYPMFLQAGVLSPEQHSLFLRAFWETAHLLDHYPFAGFNFALFRESALLLLLAEFPEFTSLRNVRQKLVGIIHEELKLQLYPDGFQKELSTVYQTVVACVAEALLYARRMGQEFDVPFRPELERAFEVWMNLGRPDGTCVSVNDAEAHDRDYHDCLRIGAELFGRSDFRYVATGGHEGSPPGHDSFMYAYAGYTVMRSGWEERDRFLLFDGGPVGINHRHEDKLNFDLFAYGQRFIVDPGIHTYGPNDYNGFFGSTLAHNTVTVDGLGQLRADIPAHWTVAEPLEILWHHGKSLDIVQADYALPYRTNPQDPRIDSVRIEGVIHTRTVLFARPDYFVIIDDIRGEGEHTTEALFHFAPIQVALDRDGTARAVGENGATLSLTPLLADGLVSEKIVGSMDPVQGWVVTGPSNDRKVVAAPVVIHRKRGRLPHRYVTVLCPAPGSASGEPACTLLNTDDDGVSFRVEAHGRRDDWHTAFLDSYVHREAGLDWAGQALLISTRNNRQRITCAVNAQRLTVDESALVDTATAFAEWG